MNDPSLLMNTTPCWVYITRRGTGPRASYRVGYAAGGTGPPAAIPGAKVVYLHPFPDPLAALGHKLLLEQLSAASLRRLIRMHPAKSTNQQILDAI